MEEFNEKKMLDKGFVKLVDYMGSDKDIVNSARVSTGILTSAKEQATEKDEKLIRYLMRHRHTSPFEMVELKFHIKTPIFIARQWVRHRTANINEKSGRYSQLNTEYYVPDKDRIKSKGKINIQGSEGDVPLEYKDEFINTINTINEKITDYYDEFNSKDISNELTRINLPLSIYTEFIWKIDLHNLLHFLKLRMDENAQYEIRVYANAIYDIIKPLFPYTIKAFEDYILNSVTFSKNELDFLLSVMESHNVGIYNTDFRINEWDNFEKNEFFNKIKNYKNSDFI